ncbi:MAG: DNA polymerase III subunit delta' [Firmicutes bacterium]|nr:DNA polymerase III subunit delta' [Bacillota bacterium]NLL89097.1 DNA polymerase III subunit delta' [Bacillota bacterium]HKM17925.1 DNA polymerase III subunit delta' [Limnochordia bacterium]
MHLGEIIEQEVAVRTLQRAVASDSIAHAYLFFGDHGVGKKTTALGFAHQILCEAKAGCGSCPQCLKLSRDNHPGLRALDPQDGTIRIEQIRSVHQQVQYAQEHYLIWIINEAHRMTPQAANSFLKLLEEPPGSVVFILITDHVEQILPTIRSRCQAISFTRLSDAAVAKALKARAAGDGGEDAGKKIELVTKMAQGSIGRAMDLWESPLLDRRKFVLEQLINLPGMSLYEVLGLSHRWEEERQLVALDLTIMLHWYRDLWCLQAGLEHQVLNLDYLHELSVSCKRYHRSSLEQISKAIIGLHGQLDRNVRIRFMMGNLLLQIRKGVLA